MKKLLEREMERFPRFIKFGIVGLSNTVISYIICVITLLAFQSLEILGNMDYLATQVIAFILSVLWISILRISKMVIPINNLLISVPVNFIMNKF